MDLVMSTAKIPAVGETVLGSAFFMAPGGKGANQAVAAAKLGGQVLMAGCVGNDVFGKQLVENLERNGVDTKNIRMLPGISTGIAVIVISRGDNFIIVDPSANYQLTPGIIAELEDVIKECSYLVVQLEIPIEAVELALAIASKHKIKTVLNPAPAAIISNEVLRKLDFLILNETESQMLTNIAVENIDDAKRVISSIQEAGVRQVIVTMGGKGVVYNKEHEFVHLPAHSVKAVDTTAAGDAFIGAVIVALSKGHNLDKAIYFGNLVGALTVMKKGAQTSLPDKKEVERFIDQIGYAHRQTGF